MKEVINQQTQPVVLDDGTILAAAGTDGSVKEVAGISENDQRLLDRGLISVRDQKLKAVPNPEVRGQRSEVSQAAGEAATAKEIK